MQTRDTIIVDMYRRQAASRVTSENSYNGLIINALPGLHDLVGATAMRLFSPNAEILDLASGSGALCARIRDLGFRPTACDLVDENFKLHGEVPFYSTNLNSELPESFRERFDGITATEIIEHLENPRNFLRQCYLTLRGRAKTTSHFA
ncbi:MAG: class I SAM-dependent methyltransferase [Acidobacteriota bacterium]